MADPKQPKRRPASKKTTSRTPAAKKRSSKPAPRRPRPDPAELDEPLEELDLGADDDGSDVPASRSSRPVAVGGAPSFLTDALEADEELGDDADDALDGSLALDEEPPGRAPAFDADAPAVPIAAPIDDIERPVYEAVAGGLGALLAVLVFLPWYKGPLTDPTGWSSGTWGPVVFGLGLAAAVIVVLRRLNVAIRFPVHHSLVLEGIGWLTVAMLLIKLNWAPRIAGPELEATWFLRGALVVALGLALVGGSVSQGVALVLRPGWFSDRAGKLGVGLLAVAVLVGGVFGLLNDAGFGSFASNPQAPPLEQGLPACAKAANFPVPAKMTPTVGGPQATHCFAQMTTRLNVDKAVAAYAKSLRGDGWAIVYDSRKDRQAQFGQLQAKKGRECGSVTVIGGKNTQAKMTQVTVIIGPQDTICNLEEKIRQQRGDQ